MRKITREAAMAFACYENFRQSNTQVIFKDGGTASTWDDTVTLELHGNAIARREGGQLSISLTGWDTLTTRERLNGLLDVLGRDARLVRLKGVTYLETRSEMAEMPLYDWVTL